MKKEDAQKLIRSGKAQKILEGILTPSTSIQQWILVIGRLNLLKGVDASSISSVNKLDNRWTVLAIHRNEVNLDEHGNLVSIAARLINKKSAGPLGYARKIKPFDYHSDVWYWQETPLAEDFTET